MRPTGSKPSASNKLACSAVQRATARTVPLAPVAPAAKPPCGQGLGARQAGQLFQNIWAVSTSLAPCRIKASAPFGLRGVNGARNRKHLAPLPLAKRAVIGEEPEARAASTTKVPHDRPAMMRLRLGKLAAQRRRAQGKFAQNQTVWAMPFASAWC